MEKLNLVGLGEMADLFGVSKQAVSNWRERNADFPTPITVLKSGPIWLLEQITAWADDNGVQMRACSEGGLIMETSGCKVIAFCNMKGGVGKSTLTANLGWYCAYKQNMRVLLIDLDPQFNLSQYALGNAKYEKLIDGDKGTIVDIFEPFSSPSSSTPKLSSPEEAISVVKKWTDGSYIHIVPSKLELGWTVRNSSDKSHLLKDFVQDVRHNYDLIFIDCPPTESMLTTAAYLAADYLMVPVRPEFLSTIGLPLLVRSLNDHKIRHKHVKHPEIAGIIFNDSSDKLEHDRSRAFVGKVAKKEGWYVFENQISHSDSYAAGARVGKPIFLTDYARSWKIQEFYNVAKEFMARIDHE